MIFNYLKDAFRFIIRNKLFTVINVLGLALGLAAGIYILMFILNEFSFDRFNKNLDSIYRINWTTEHGDTQERSGVITAGVGPSMLEEFPEIKRMSRFSNPSGAFVQFDDKSFRINHLSYVDSSFFQIFSYPLLRGDAAKIFRGPYEIALSETLAREIFGNEDPIGKVLRLDKGDNFLISGIFKDVPVNSHLLFDALISFSTLYHYHDMALGWNGGVNYYTYVQLQKNTDPHSLEEKFPDFMEKHINYIYRDAGWLVSQFLQPLARVHLYSDFVEDVESQGSLTRIYILSAIALLIILMACINFINLSTARALKRAREIGIRKVMGATRAVLIRQFLLESFLYILLSFILALVFVDIFQDFFNELIGKEFRFFDTGNAILFISLPLILIIIGLLAGGYPALYLSRFQPLKVLKGISSRGNSRSYFRNGLVVFQFFITSILIISTLVIYRQLRYVDSIKPGYDKEGVIVLPLNSSTLMQNLKILKQDILNIPGIINAGASSDVPGYDFTRNGYIVEEKTEAELFNVIDIDADYLETMKIKLLEGRNFDPGMNSDSMAYLVNEKFVKEAGWDDALGKTISRGGKHKIIGVVADFNFASMHKEIAPLILTMVPWKAFNYLSLRINTRDLNSLLPKIESAWKSADSSIPFDFFFLDARLRQAYQTEQNFGKMFRYFGIIAIVIACLGLLGLSSFITEQRRKEVGIRKVLGASSIRIMTSYTGNFLILVLIANIIAWPLAWYVMNVWLERFAYRINIGIFVLLSAFLISSLITVITIGIQVYRAANANPVKALKYE